MGRRERSAGLVVGRWRKLLEDGRPETSSRSAASREASQAFGRTLEISEGNDSTVLS
jgi:hypothetical protein